MTKVVGIRFRRAGKIYHFSPGNIETKAGDHVIVETSRGIEYGTIAIEEHEEENEAIVQPLKEVLRVATEEDTAHEAENKKKEMEAFVTCLDKIKKHELQMKLIDCEITFDNSKMLFYFTADGRIDFRDLVKDLASVFHTRIELRQEGVRDETKTLGGLGCCGRELCCHAYLTDFVPVSIKMAKNQNLSLNTSKISGVCGRLMCCLKYEENVYEELNKKLPSTGDSALTPDGLRGTVTVVNTLKQRVKVLVDLPNDEKEIRDYAAAEIKFKSRKKGSRKNDDDDFDDYLQKETAALEKNAQEKIEEEIESKFEENNKNSGNQADNAEKSGAREKKKRHRNRGGKKRPEHTAGAKES